MRFSFLIFFIIHYLFNCYSAHAQTLAEKRSLQLKNNIQPDRSFLVERSEILLDSIVGKKEAVKLIFLPLHAKIKVTTAAPYGWNDLGMKASNGFQSMIRAGLNLQIKKLEVQLAPEFVWSQNARYRTNTMYGPSIFGPVSRVYPGQSYLKLNSKNLSIGVSTENLWWGPGQFNALLMSNNAPGFPHISFNTRRPVRTSIGNFEWQLIAANPSDDNSSVYENYYLKRSYESYPFLVGPASDTSRYLNGVVVTYNPKWTPGLFVGFSRVFQMYRPSIRRSEGSFMNRYLPVFSALFKAGTTNEDIKARDQLLSLFIRWLNTKERFETYLEYGLNDHTQNIRDFLMSPDHSAAFIFGLKKLFNTKTSGTSIDLSFELTHLSQSTRYITRDAGNWYWHSLVYSGYTNKNQIIGAGVGSGNNVQTIQMLWVSDAGKKGFLIERLEHDPVFHTTKWNDVSAGLIRQWNLKGLTLNTRLQIIRSVNFAWEKGPHKWNLLGMLNASWRLK